MATINIAHDLGKLSHSAIVTLYELDATVLGGTVFRWHNRTNELGQSVVWQGQTYQYFPIEVSGFEVRAEGPLPRPTLRVSNAYGLVGALVRQYKGLKGARLTRKRTLAKYLDAVNFAAGNASADPTAQFDDDVWYLDRQAERNARIVVYELASPLDLAGTMLPRRQVIAGVCAWLADGGYRGANCGYTGPAVAKADDTPTSSLSQDACGGRLSSCRLRQWPNRELAFGGFPGVGVLRNV